MNDLESRFPTLRLSRRHLIGASTAGGIATLGASFLATAARAQAPEMRVKVIYPSRSPATWLLWIASRAGYLKAEGVDADLSFAVHPAGMAALIGGEAQFTVYELGQILTAAARDSSLLVTNCYLNRGGFSLVARNDVTSIKNLKGKRVGVGRVGDPLYTFTVELLARSGLTARDVVWVASGTDSSTRGPMLLNGQLDAALLVSPAYLRLLETNQLRQLVNLLETDIPISAVTVYSRKAVAAMPRLPESVTRACAQATKRFYEDRPFAVEAYRAADPQYSEKDIDRIYDLYVKAQAFARVPVLTKTALKQSIARVATDVPAIKSVPVSQYVDNSVVIQLAKSGYFEKLFGPSVRAEQDAALADAA